MHINQAKSSPIKPMFLDEEKNLFVGNASNSWQGMQQGQYVFPLL